jgi:hypothetical protein
MMEIGANFQIRQSGSREYATRTLQTGGTEVFWREAGREESWKSWMQESGMEFGGDFKIYQAGFREYAIRASPSGATETFWRRAEKEESWKPWARETGLDDNSQTMDTQYSILHLVRQSRPSPQQCLWLLWLQQGQIGDTYQVTGAGVAVARTSEQDFTITQDFFDIYQLAKLDQRGKAVFLRAVESEQLLCASTKENVKDNSQDWTASVVKRLENDGLVDKKWVKALENLLEQ